jgi:hypothetical protein
MPIQYAIRTKRTAAIAREEQDDLKAQGFSEFELDYSYEDVPYVVADMDEENGVYAFFAENGTKISDWMLVRKPDEIQQAYVQGRQKQGASIYDSIGQSIHPGDYLYTHNRYYHSKLELTHLVRNLRSRIVVEYLTDSQAQTKLKTGDPSAFLRIPSELVEGGKVTPATWTKQYAIRSMVDGSRFGPFNYLITDKTTAQANPQGHFGYFNAENKIVGQWVPIIPTPDEIKVRNRAWECLDTPLTDALGTDILLGDLVFSVARHSNQFLLGEVIGFREGKLQLVRYNHHMRDIKVHSSKNVVKLPLIISE